MQQFLENIISKLFKIRKKILVSDKKSIYFQ
jgi:hypothetical protein